MSHAVNKLNSEITRPGALARAQLLLSLRLLP
jgi:hypothetical protein